MRELKFRAWDAVDKRYYYWSIDACFAVGASAGCMEKYTFEQYTGIKDKNGKEIYEGDIVKYDCRGSRYTVAYRKYDASFVLENDDREEIIFFHYDKQSDYEILGNIHENPELLEEQ